MLVDIRRGASNGHVCRIYRSVSNKMLKGRVVMICAGKMFPAVETCLGVVRRWDEHHKFLFSSNN